MCLAGLSSLSKENYDLLNEVPFMLESFYYFKDFQTEAAANADLFLLDSGAFTFMNSSKGKVSFDDYLTKYIDFINRNNIKHFFELDIDSIVGLAEVERLRNRLEAETDKKCIPVWHRSRGKQYFIDLCKNYNYVSIGGIVTKEIVPAEYKYFNWFIGTAHENNCKIHGLGLTNVEAIKQYHFDSVDSTTWNRTRFGEMCLFRDGRIEYMQYKGQRLKNEMRDQAERVNLQEWIKFQKYAEIHY